MTLDVSTKENLILCFDKPSSLRSSNDLDVIYNSLKSITAYSGLHPYLLQQMCRQVQYEHLKERIVVYQGGKPEKNCYVVMSGSLIVVERDRVPEILNRDFMLQESKNYPLICEGSVFANSSKCATPNSSQWLNSKAVVTKTECELLYMEQKCFQEIWSKNEKLLRDLNLSRDINFSATTTELNEARHISNLSEDFDCKNISVPTKVSCGGCQNALILSAAYFVFKSSKCLLRPLPGKPSGKLTIAAPPMMFGEEMVTWMLQFIRINSRLLAIGIWQVLLEHGILVSLTSSYCFRDTSTDSYVFAEEFITTQTPSSNVSDDLESTINYLMKLAPDSLFRMILSKSVKERTKDELEFIYGELIHIKAFSRLSSMVKRQLAALLTLEIHPQKGRVLFSQGSEGTSWYIIIKGTVDVHIKGKGVVCRLRENDDFGKLALVNNSLRAATIVLREDNCQFLKIDKDDFNRVLRDVEVNTVRLTEHGKDVLILERRVFESQNQKPCSSVSSSTVVSIYSVLAGTPEKLLEHLLDNRIDLGKSYATILERGLSYTDPILETFFLTYFAFISSHGLCSLLMVYFQNFDNHTNTTDGGATPMLDNDHERVVVNRKTRIVHFLYWWCRISEGGFFDDQVILGFIENLLNIYSPAATTISKEYLALNCLLEQFRKAEIVASKKVGQRSRLSKNSGTGTGNQLTEISPIKPKILTQFVVYLADSSNCMLRLPVESRVEQIVATVSKHQNLFVDKLSLCEVKSDGEKIVFDNDDVGVMFSLSVNGKIYLLTEEQHSNHLHSPDFQSCFINSPNAFESATIDEFAFHLTFLDWQLFKNIHVYELLFKVLGRPKFGRITSNLDCFIRQFTSIQYWVATEICQCQNSQKRVNIIKKMIKLANRLSELKNISSSFAVLMGLNNSAVSRLQLTWERVTNKHKKMFNELCVLLDPTRNHCTFRQYLKKTTPPIIPFVAIMLKDLTFINDANKTYLDDCMINFEKMQLFAATLLQFLHCRARPMVFENTMSTKKDKLANTEDVQNFVRNLRSCDNQKMLTNMSLSLEARHANNNNAASVTFALDN